MSEVQEKVPYTAEELRAMLKEQEAKEVQERENKRATYEKNKHQLVEALVAEGTKIHSILKDFKSKATHSLNEFYKELQAYGDVRKGNKGTFTIENAEKDLSVTYKRNAVFGFDERGNVAADLLNQFLENKVRNRDKRAYKMIKGLLEKNSADEYDPRNINKIYKLKHQKEFQDELFQKAVETFEEAYVERDTAYYIMLKYKDGEGKWQNINLNWSSL